MKGRLYQYLYSVLFALLTVLGLYYGQMQQYISSGTSPDFPFSAKVLTKQNKDVQQMVIAVEENQADGIYNTDHPHYTKIKANLTENDTENDDTVESSSSPELLAFFRDGFGRFISDFVTTYHNREIAVSLAHSELLKPLDDDLYLQYRVIRL